VLYLLERGATLTETIAQYAPQAIDALTRYKGYRLTAAQAVRLLMEPLVNAYQHRDEQLAIDLNSAIVRLYFDAGEFEAARQYSEQLLRLTRDSADHVEHARSLSNLAAIELYMGNPAVAYTNLLQAIECVHNLDTQAIHGYLLSASAMVQCYLGNYPAASSLFDEARQIFQQNNNALGRSWHNQLYAREYLRDQGRYAEAIEMLQDATEILFERASPQVLIENLLTLADCHVNLGQYEAAASVLQQVEPLVLSGGNHWYKPELSLLKGMSSMIQGAASESVKLFTSGIGSVSMGGDPRLLCTLYRGLGLMLSQQKATAGAALDAFERSITCGNHHARRLHLAMALRDAGNFLKRNTNRPTDRARGSGFIFESHLLLKDMSFTNSML